ncbi:MAG TPA: hypothetical protein VGK60_02735, partial [Pedococcus sp.]
MTIDDGPVVQPRIDAPWLAVFGRAVSLGEPWRLDRHGRTQVEQWQDSGHVVHLVHLERFTDHLPRFISHCTRIPT